MKNIKKVTLFVIAFSLIVKIFGMLRDVVISSVFGPSIISDAFIISFTIPGTIFSILGAGIVAGYIPTYNSLLIKDGNQKATNFTNSLLKFTILLVIVIIAISFIFTKQVVLLFASGFTGEQLSLSITFTRITIFSTFSSLLVTIFSGYLNIKKKYFVTTLIGLPLNLIIITFIIISKSYGIILLPIGYLLGTFSQILIMIPFIIKSGFVFDLRPRISNRASIMNLFVMSLPIIIGTAAYNINSLVDKTIASRISLGGVTIISLASRLIVFIQTIIVISIMNVYFPRISETFAQNDIKKFNKTINEALSFASLLIIPASLALLIFSGDIIKVVYYHGSFTISDVKLTAKVLTFYGLSMIGFSFKHIISRIYYSIGNTKTPMYNTILSIGINITLNLVFYKFTNMGLAGLALATTIAFLISGVVLLIQIVIEKEIIKLKYFIESLLKILLSSIIMLVICYVLKALLSGINPYLSLPITTLSGLVIYYILLLIFKEKDAINLQKKLMGKIKTYFVKK